MIKKALENAGISVGNIITLVTLIITMSVAWSTSQAQIKANEKSIIEQRILFDRHAESCELRNNRSDEKLLEIQVTLAEIKTQQVNIQAQILDLKKTLSAHSTN